MLLLAYRNRLPMLRANPVQRGVTVDALTLPRPARAPSAALGALVADQSAQVQGSYHPRVASTFSIKTINFELATPLAAPSRRPARLG